jgi:hypothetical protein
MSYLWCGEGSGEGIEGRRLTTSEREGSIGEGWENTRMNGRRCEGGENEEKSVKE